ncbi:MAG TPA: lipid II flippase MurJ [Phycisphaerae bacterium]|nr:lipid II flippase MurJ [Phycisphaerae bacterium]
MTLTEVSVAGIASSRSSDGAVEAPGSLSAASLRSIFVSVGGIALIVMACKVAGFAEKVVVAHYLGTTRAADCYYVAFTLTWTLVFVILELVQPSVLPVYAALMRAEHRILAQRVVTALAVLLTVIVLGFASLLVLAPEGVVVLIAPGLDEHARAAAGALARSMAAGTSLLAFMALTRTILHAHKRFWWAAMGDFVFRSCYLLVFVLGFARWGSNYAGLAVGAAALVALAVHLTGLRRDIRPASPATDREAVAASLRQVLILIAPLLIGVVFSHVNQVLDSVLASTLPPGRLSALAYAKKLTDTLVLVGPAALATVTFSHFSSWAARGELRQVGRQLARCVRIVLIAGVPLAVLVITLRHPLIHLLFERGKFDAASTRLTASALGCYALGIIAFSLDGLLVSTFYAVRDTKTPVLIGVAGAACDVALALWLMRRFGHLGIAVSVSITKTAKVVVLGLLLRRRFPGEEGAEAAVLLFRLLLPGFALLMVAFGVPRLFGAMWGLESTGMEVACTAAAASVGGLAFGVVAWLMGVPEVDALARKGVSVMRRLPRWSAKSGRQVQ